MDPPQATQPTCLLLEALSSISPGYFSLFLCLFLFSPAFMASQAGRQVGSQPASLSTKDMKSLWESHEPTSDAGLREEVCIHTRTLTDSVLISLSSIPKMPGGIVMTFHWAGLGDYPKVFLLLQPSQRSRGKGDPPLVLSIRSSTPWLERD